MCPPITHRPAPRFDPLLRGLRNAKCVRVCGRVVKFSPQSPEMTFCAKCYPESFRRFPVQPLWQHKFCDGPFAMEHCRVCGKEIAAVRPIQHCDRCFPMYIRVYNTLKEANYNMNELLVLHYNITTCHVIRLHFNFISPPFIENPDPEDRDNMLEPYM